MERGRTNLIELAFDENGHSCIRVHELLWKLIRKAEEREIPEGESHVSLQFEPGIFGEFKDRITFPGWWVDAECYCAPDESRRSSHE